MLTPKQLDLEFSKIMARCPELYCINNMKNRPDKCKKYLLRNALERAYKLGVKDGQKITE